jgi:hypothetical protein
MNQSELKFDLNEHSSFRDALLDMLDSRAMVADGDRLLNQLENFVKNQTRHGQLLRSNGSVRAFYVGDRYTRSEVPGAFTIVIEESGKVIDARLYISKGMKTAAWQTLYTKVILWVEKILEI